MDAAAIGSGSAEALLPYTSTPDSSVCWQLRLSLLASLRSAWLASRRVLVSSRSANASWQNGNNVAAMPIFATRPSRLCQRRLSRIVLQEGLPD